MRAIPAAHGPIESLLSPSAWSRETLLVLIRNQWSEHVPWIAACLIVTALSICWFALACVGQSAYPSGSSLPGFTFGVIGGAICLFEFLLWPRKKLRTWRIG